MARHGENIRKRTDGRWEGRYKMLDENRGRQIYRSVYGCTYEEVKEKLVRAKTGLTYTGAAGKVMQQDTDCQKQDLAGNDAILFSRAAGEWLMEIVARRKHSTYIKYNNIYQTHLAETIGSCRLTDDASSDIQAALSGYFSTGMLSESLQRSIYSLVNQILAFAHRKYAIDISLLVKPEMKHKCKPVETLSRAEQARLLSGIYDSPELFKTALMLCLYTGLRLGELCALKWTDFDLKGMSVTVNRTVQRIAVQNGRTKTILMETPPKSEGSLRTIPLPSEISELLLQLERNKPYTFGGDKPLEPRTMQYRFKRLLKAADIDERNFHILRHTFATNCIENGMDVKALSEILGHSDVKITLNRYVHPTMDSKRKQLGRLSGFYDQILKHVS